MQFLPGISFADDDYEFIPRDAGTERDLLDPSPRNLAANGCSEEHVGQNHVIDVLRPSGHLVAPFFARNRFADDGICVHRCESLEESFDPRLAGQTAAEIRGWDSV